MATIHELIEKIDNPELRDRIAAEVDKLTKQKKFGLVFEEHLPECTPLYDIPVRKGAKVALKTGKVSDYYTVLKIQDGKALCLNQDQSETAEFPLNELVCVAEFGEPIYPYLQPLDTVCNAPDSDLWHTLIEADNYHALQLLEYLYAGKVDCIYIDPPYNTGARDWKYNNDYVDNGDQYRHSKWLSMMQKRLKLAKKLLNPMDSVLIVTIDEKEYLHLGCLLEEMFSEARIQMINVLINPQTVSRPGEFGRTDEYIFFVQLGDSKPQQLSLSSEWKAADVAPNENGDWSTLRRRGTHSLRTERPGCFYPIFVDKLTRTIVSVGETLPMNVDKNTVAAPEGQYAVFPMKPKGIDGTWQLSQEELLARLKQGYVRIGTDNEYGPVINYLALGAIKKIEQGIYSISGKRNDGSVILKWSGKTAPFVPGSQWRVKSHNASQYGSILVNSIIGSGKFSFPKSVYATSDTIGFFVANKPNALILDFFAGSGTTLHAVNLLNAEDGGHRRCIMVTNNEVSADEAKYLSALGYQPGDPEWERLGIAHYVTWPRTVCSIEGHDINGQPLKGNYLGGDPDHPLAMADGFKANAAFFKLGFLDKNAVAVGRQFKELLSTLWMKAGAHGPYPVIEDGVPDMLILPENRMAILNDENCFGDFAEQLAAHPEIDVVFLVTDYEAGFAAMTAALPGKQTYQLYRDYLDNFRINAGRNAR